MKIKNISLLEMNAFLSQFEDKKLPQKIVFAIMKNLSIYAKEQQFYQNALKKILSKYEEYIEVDEDGNKKNDANGLPVIIEAQRVNFYEEINDLLMIETEIKPYYISKDVFEYEDTDNKYDTLTAKEMFLLMSVLCEPEGDEKEAE